VDRRHEDAAHRVDDRHRDAGLRPREVDASPRSAGGKIRRPNQPRVLVEIRKDFLPVPDVIAAGHHIDAVLEEVIGDVRRDAEPGSRVLHVRDDEIDPMMCHQRTQPATDELPSWLSNDVADEQQPGHPGFTGTMITLPRRSSMRGRMTRSWPAATIAVERPASIAASTRTAL